MSKNCERNYQRDQIVIPERQKNYSYHVHHHVHHHSPGKIVSG